MSDRGMKKWAPYKSLIEQDPALLEMEHKRKKVDRPIVSEDVAEEINEILTNYNGETLLIKIYKNGYISEVETTIAKIDPVERRLILPDRKNIYLKDIVGLSKIN